MTVEASRKCTPDILYHYNKNEKQIQNINKTKQTKPVVKYLIDFGPLDSTLTFLKNLFDLCGLLLLFQTNIILGSCLGIYFGNIKKEQV
jgi:hypothetical protein